MSTTWNIFIKFLYLLSLLRYKFSTVEVYRKSRELNKFHSFFYNIRNLKICKNLKFQFFILFSDSGDSGIAPTVAVRPNNISSRPVVESLASQLQRQKISAEGASGYSKFKSDFQVRIIIQTLKSETEKVFVFSNCKTILSGLNRLKTMDHHCRDLQNFSRSARCNLLQKKRSLKLKIRKTSQVIKMIDNPYPVQVS